MAKIKILVQVDERSPLKETIIEETGLPAMKRVFAEDLKDFYYVDDNGNRIKKDVTPKFTKEEIAFEAMKSRAKDLKIKGWALMKEDQLLKAIQKASN